MPTRLFVPDDLSLSLIVLLARAEFPCVCVGPPLDDPILLELEEVLVFEWLL